eukprot:gene3563-3903_t
MLYFARDDRIVSNNSAGTAAVDVSSSSNKLAPHRINGLRHNPYVGTFFNQNYLLQEEGGSAPSSSAATGPTPASASTNLLTESKNNPLIGVFRHSPSAIRTLGLKVGMYQDSLPSAPVISRLLHLPRETASLTLSTRHFVSCLKQIPKKKFSASSVSSRTSLSSLPFAANETPLAEQAEVEEDENLNQEDPDLPVCSICLEVYKDGDEIQTLACSHCFHADCGNKWFKQDHIALSEASSATGSCLEAGIIAQSCLSLGRSLFLEGGYDFLSDVTSEPPLSVPSQRASQQEVRRTEGFDDDIDWSTYSDCGLPLRNSPARPLH